MAFRKTKDGPLESDLPIVLAFLKENQPILPGALGKHLGVEQPDRAIARGSKRLSGLLRAGLVKRNGKVDDNVAPTYQLTDAGVQMADKLASV